MTDQPQYMGRPVDPWQGQSGQQPRVPASPGDSGGWSAMAEQAGGAPAKKRRMVPLWVAGATGLVLLGIGYGAGQQQVPAGQGTGGSGTTSVVVSPSPVVVVSTVPAVVESKPAPVVTKGPPPAVSIADEGTLLVPSEVKPGTYRATVPGDSSNCYWARLKNLDGSLDSIIANENSAPGAKVTVKIGSGDKAFEHHGCGVWVKIG